MNEEIVRLLHKEWGHPNFTIGKGLRFGLGYGMAYPVGLLALWLLTEKAGIWYIYSSILAGGLSAVLRFVAAALIFGKKEGV